MTDLILAPRIVTAHHDLRDGWLAVRDGVVAGVGTVVGAGIPSAFADAPVTRVDGVLVPGLVDIHAHGALGVDFAAASAPDARRAAEHHAARGTTALVASLATGTPDATAAAIARLAPLVADGTLVGLHLEGPWLSPERRGAHAAALLHAPGPDEVRRYLDIAAGSIRMVTLAPELPGAMTTIPVLVAAGVVVAIGHTDCDAETARRAVDAGARVATHLFNGMPPLHHRTPGPVGVALADDRVVLELIVDDHHLHPVTVDAVHAAGAHRVALVSDAMAATGCADGPYRIAGSDVVVAGGVAMLADGSSLAGSTITVADGVARYRNATGADLPALVRASSTTAGALLGLPPALTEGAPADAVVLDPDTCLPAARPGPPTAGTPRTVLRRGRWLASS